MYLAGQPIPALRHRRMLQGRRVLVVEDNAMICMLMEDGLIDAGAEIVGPAYCVAQALGLIEGAAVDGGLNAAVLDINLDGEAVSPVADRLAALGVPFIFATGHPEWYNTTAPRLVKPFDGDTLADAVKDLIAGRWLGVLPAQGEERRPRVPSVRL